MKRLCTNARIVGIYTIQSRIFTRVILFAQTRGEIKNSVTIWLWIYFQHFCERCKIKKCSSTIKLREYLMGISRRAVGRSRDVYVPPARACVYIYISLKIHNFN